MKMKGFFLVAATIISISYSCSSGTNTKQENTKAENIKPVLLLRSEDSSEVSKLAIKYLYDAENRLTALDIVSTALGTDVIIKDTIVYNQQGQVVSCTSIKQNADSTVDTTVYNFKYTNNIIDFGQGTCEINDQGLLVKSTNEEKMERFYAYDKQNNLVADSTRGNEPRKNVYTYDSKSGPLKNCKTPTWFLKWAIEHLYFGVGDASKSFLKFNNDTALKANSKNELLLSANYTYTYNAEGFPTQIISESLGESSTIKFEYSK